MFVTLKPFAERQGKDMSANAIAGAMNAEFGKLQDAFVVMFPPPPVQGLGTPVVSSCNWKTVAAWVTRRWTRQ